MDDRDVTSEAQRLAMMMATASVKNDLPAMQHVIRELVEFIRPDPANRISAYAMTAGAVTTQALALAALNTPQGEMHNIHAQLKLLGQSMVYPDQLKPE